MTKGLYYLITLSIFDSKYRGGDKIWRNTMYNKNYLSNLLIGKEWGMGRKKVNVFGASVRLSYQGGNRYTPYDKDASKLMKSVVYDYSNPFSAQLKPDLLLHLTVLYKINRKKVAHEFALKILNATMVKDFEGFKYNYQTGEVDNISEALLLPNISYKLDFSL